jgi:3-mercaptopyruvate sulfurtransferase SseA
VKNVKALTGGIFAWQDAKYPVTTGPNPGR